MRSRPTLRYAVIAGVSAGLLLALVATIIGVLRSDEYWFVAPGVALVAVPLAIANLLAWVILDLFAGAAAAARTGMRSYLDLAAAATFLVMLGPGVALAVTGYRASDDLLWPAAAVSLANFACMLTLPILQQFMRTRDA
jgi:hypothetical protein